MKNAIKAQVYLTNLNDLPEFVDVWNSHLGDHPCALTVVATKGLALLESILEINIFGVRDNAKTKKEIVDHKPSQHMRLGPAAVQAGDLLCLSGLYAADSDGAIPQARGTAGLKYFVAPTHHEMQGHIDGRQRHLSHGRHLAREFASRQSLPQRSQFCSFRIADLAREACGCTYPVRCGPYVGADARAWLQYCGGHVDLLLIAQIRS